MNLAKPERPSEVAICAGEVTASNRKRGSNWTAATHETNAPEDRQSRINFDNLITNEN
jgi:hypothetical protein